MTAWADQVRALGVSTVAAAFGLKPTRGRGLSPCPSCNEVTRHPSRRDTRGAVGLTGDGAGWRCFECSTGGDAVTLAALVVTGGRGLQREDWPAVHRACAKLGLCDSDLSGAPPPAVRHGASPPATPPRRPSGVADLWAACHPVTADAEVSTWLAGRALDGNEVESRDLARVLPSRSPLPRWARFQGRPWTTTTHRLLVPMYGPAGDIESLHARALVSVAPGDKAASPAGAEVRGLVMADSLGRLMLAGAALADGTPSAGLLRRTGVWIAEGLPDFLTLATTWSDADADAPAVLGIVAGSLTAEIAARVPDGCEVVVATDPDAAGEKYMQRILETLAERMRAGRVRVRRWKSKRGAES